MPNVPAPPEVGELRPLRGASITLLWSGYQYTIAGPVADYLVARGATVTCVTHPLFAHGSRERILTRRGPGVSTDRRSAPLGLRPPASYALDPLWPPRLPRADLAIGFGCLVTSRLLLERQVGRVGQVVHWNIDYVPQRFENRSLDRIYRFLDRNACLRADVRLDLNERALAARTDEYGLQRSGAIPMVVPVGIWAADVARCAPEAYDARTLVFLGNLAERQGIFEFVDMMRILVDEVPGVRAEVVGGGDIESAVRARADALGLADVVRFHGDVNDPTRFQEILAGCSIGCAPYRKDPSSFSNFADPSKVKSYLGASLPVIITDVPPIARTLEATGAAVVAEPEPADLARAARVLLDDRAAWQRARRSSGNFADSLDWNRVLGDFFPRIGWAP